MSKFWIVILSAGGFLLLLVLLFFPSSDNQRTNEPIIRASRLISPPIRLQARLDRNRIEDDSEDTLQVRVVNDSSQEPLRSLHLSLVAPGFALDQNNLICSGANPDNTILANQSCQFAVKLLPNAKSGVYGIAATVDWNQPRVAGRATLLLDPITIDRTWGAAQWRRAGARLTTLLKELTLPIILVVLGSILAGRQQSAEARRAEAEKLRDEARITARTEQDERQEVRHLLLTRVMELAEQHYLLFASHAKQIVIESEKIRLGKPDAAPDKVFLHVMILLKRMKVFRLTKGGIFLKTREGEYAVAAAWALLTISLYGAMGHENTAAALKFVEMDWDYATYKAQLANLIPAWNEFQSWLAEPEDSTDPKGSFRQIIGVVDAFQAIIRFEADTALSKYWYEEEGKVDFALDAPTILFETPSTDKFSKQWLSTLEGLLKNSYSREVRVKVLRPIVSEDVDPAHRHNNSPS